MPELRVVIPTARYDESLTFYRDVLGWTEVRSWASPDRGVIVRIGSEAGGEAVVELLEQSDDPSIGEVFCSLEVADAAATAVDLEAAGGVLTQAVAIQPWGHVNVGIDDPNGVRWIFFSPAP